MTASTPAPKASGVSALLASFSSNPPPPPPSANDNFMDVMLQALVPRGDGADRSPAAQSPPQKASAKDATVPDPTAVSLLLASLAPPLPNFTKAPSNKVSAASVADAGSDSPPSAPAQTDKEKPTPTPVALDLTAASLLLGLLAPPLLNLVKPLLHKASSAPVPVVPSIPSVPAAPTETAGETKPSKTDTADKTPPLLAQVTPVKEPEIKPPPTSGTSAANTNQRMSFVPERNEIAGRVEQKLPPPGISAVSSADSGGSSPDSGAKSSLAFSWHDAPTEPLTIVDLSAKAAATVAPVADIAVDAPARTSSTTSPLERLEQMISREVVSVRQFGAQTLGVTLKLDVNTQLYLELTTHNGMVQASVRAERGNFAPEDAQWAQLQQSLARQNVELMPMTGSSNLNFKQPSDERPRQPAAREDRATGGAAVQPAQPRKQQQEQKQNRSRKNWESWA